MRYKDGTIRLPVRPTRMKDGHTASNVDEKDKRADRLRKHSRKRRAGDSPLENEDCDWLKYYVESERDAEKNRRCFAVTERTDQAVLQNLTDRKSVV